MARQTGTKHAKDFQYDCRQGRWSLLLIVFCSITLLPGCGAGDGYSGQLETVWGRRGISNGRFNKPRSLAVDANDHVYVVDKTARIQSFELDGKFLRSWSTPEHKTGCPTGIGVDRRGNILVADTHYFRVLVYSPQGTLLETIGGKQGNAPGEFGWVTDAVEDSHGNMYVSEYGQYDRIQKLDPQRKYLMEWGSHGDGPGQFKRPQDLAIDAQDRIWVADACNHRIQVFDGTGRLQQSWGKQGTAPGELSYPYDLALDGEGHVYVCEYGNHRVQKFTLDGRSLGCWGGEGREPGRLYNPWALALDSDGGIVVLDTNNHRVQRIRL